MIKKIFIGSGFNFTRQFEEFAVALKRIGVECKVCKQTEIITSYRSSLHPTRYIKKIRNGTTSKDRKQFTSIIEEFQPDLILIDRFDDSFGVEAIKSGIPVIILVRGDWWGMADRRYKQSIKMRIGFTLFVNRFAKFVLKNSIGIITVDDYCAGIVSQRYPKKILGTVPDGQDPSKWNLNINIKELKHPCIGILQDVFDWEKGREILLLKDVIGRLPNVTVYWAGDGDKRDEILAELDHFENFIYLGRLNGKEKVMEFLRSIDLYILLSGIGGSGLSMREGMLMEKPIISTRVGRMNDLIEDKKFCLFYNKGDSNDLYKKINTLLNDKNLSQKLGKNAREYVVSSFSWDKIAEHFMKIISRIDIPKNN